MPQIEATFVVEPYDITITTDSSNIQVQPTAIDLNIFTAGFSPPAGNNGELQYNNAGVLAGVPVALYSNGNVNFSAVSNVKIPGGANTYFLQTDGTGNLTWAPGTVTANTGNGIASGANTQIQMTDGTGNFVGAPGFTFDYVANSLTVPGDGLFSGNVTANYFFGNGAFLTGIDPSEISNGSSNVKVYNNGNVAFSIAGVSNIAVVDSFGATLIGNINTDNANLGNVAIANYFVGNIANGNISNITFANIDNANINNLQVNSGNITLGSNAGNVNQGTYGIAIGYEAGMNNQGSYSLALGWGAGREDQLGPRAIAIGHEAGQNLQSQDTIAIGTSAGYTNQKSNAIALGYYAGFAFQGNNSIAIGALAGYDGVTAQPTNSIVINATNSNLQSDGANRFFVKPVRNTSTSDLLYYNSTTGEISYSTAPSTSIISNGTSNISIPSANGNVVVSVAGNANVLTITGTGINVNGTISGNIPTANFANFAGNVTVAAQPNITSLGNLTTLTLVSNIVKLGNGSSATSNGVAIGANSTATGTGPVAIGRDSSAGFSGVAVGYGARANSSQTIAIGEDAIATSSQTIAIGNGARTGTGVSDAIAIGQSAIANTTNSVSIGFLAGSGSTTGANKIAIGYQAGMSSTTSDTIAIGARAGRSAQAQNTIILNASGANLNATTANTFTVKPIRNLANNNVLMYNATTGEITYDTLQNYTTYVKTISTTVGALANAATIGAGGRAFVTDANTTTFNAVVGGGGANSVPVFSDGTDWKVG